ncbi:MAG: dihydroorotase [Candidatus Levyibacteriota bacterium]
MLKLPGLIDLHVHLRDLEDSHKEDFFTGTKAAIAGGYTTVFDMPNNPTVPTLINERLVLKEQTAKEKIVCDVGFYFGSTGENLDEFEKVKENVWGLKIFLNKSTGNLNVNLETFLKICEKWPTTLPILLHAEESIITDALKITSRTGHNVHICHVSSEIELTQIIDAKEEGIKVTCGVTPHHLFLSEEDREKLGPFGMMKPPLKSKKDVAFLWEHLSAIDVVESDHAPHTKEEKELEKVPFGVPGLETTLPLLLTAMTENKLTLTDILRLCHDNPAKILGFSHDETTHIEVDENEEWTIQNDTLNTKCGWSPFNGWHMKGRVKRVVVRGTSVYENGEFFVEPGHGKILKKSVE